MSKGVLSPTSAWDDRHGNREDVHHLRFAHAGGGRSPPFCQVEFEHEFCPRGRGTIVTRVGRIESCRLLAGVGGSYDNGTADMGVKRMTNGVDTRNAAQSEVGKLENAWPISVGTIQHAGRPLTKAPVMDIKPMILCLVLNMITIAFLVVTLRNLTVIARNLTVLRQHLNEMYELIDKIPNFDKY